MRIGSQRYPNEVTAPKPPAPAPSSSNDAEFLVAMNEPARPQVAEAAEDAPASDSPVTEGAITEGAVAEDHVSEKAPNPAQKALALATAARSPSSARSSR